MCKRVIFAIVISLIVNLFINSQAFSFETSADYAILIDCNTSEVLYEKKSNAKMHPSSLTKLLTSYVVFEKLKELDCPFILETAEENQTIGHIKKEIELCSKNLFT